MIKFFRKIRQQLLAEGKTGAYVKYALGEIILVVIGVLIVRRTPFSLKGPRTIQSVHKEYE